MNNARSIINYINKVLLVFLKNFFENRQNYYLIKVCSLSFDETSNQLQVKYQFVNKRMCGTASLKEFIKSPLIHLVHPEQVYYLGYDSQEILSKLKTVSPEKMSQNALVNIANRFKRFFYNENS